MTAYPGSGAQAVRTRLWFNGTLQTENFPLEALSEHLLQDGALVWVDLLNPDHSLLAELAEELSLDPRAVEDVVEHSERTKASRYATHTFLTVYATALGTQIPGSIESRLLTARISIFVLPTGVVTVRHEKDSPRTFRRRRSHPPLGRQLRSASDRNPGAAARDPRRGGGRAVRHHPATR